MPYEVVPLSARPSRQSRSQSLMPNKGINTADWGTLIGLDQAKNIENLRQIGVGRWRKSEGQSLTIDESSANPITMLRIFDNTNAFEGFDNDIRFLDLSAGTSTLLKGDFTTTDKFDGVRYGKFFIGGNKGEKPYVFFPEGKFLDIDGGGIEFVVGEVVTDGGTGATATVHAEEGNSTSGTLVLKNVVGTFTNNNAITGDIAGTATIDGAPYDAFQLTNAVKADIFHVAASRLYMNNVDNIGQIVWSAVDDGTGIPFNDTYVTSGTSAPAADAPFHAIDRRRGDVAAISSQETATNEVRIFVTFDDGKVGFRISQIDVAGTITQLTTVDFEKTDFGGSGKVAQAPDGSIAYANEFGAWLWTPNGEDREITNLIDDDDKINWDFSNADVIYSPKQQAFLWTFIDNATSNNTVLMQFVKTGARAFRVGWNISRLMLVQDNLYGGDSKSAKVFKLFDGESDDGNDIATLVEMEYNLDLNTLYDMFNFGILGKLSNDSVINVYFDKHDEDYAKFVGVKKLQWTSKGVSEITSGMGAGGMGTGGMGGSGEKISQMQPQRADEKTSIRSFTRLSVRIFENGIVPYELNSFYADIRARRNVRNNNFTTIN